MKNEFTRAINYLSAIFAGLLFWNRPAHDPDLGWHLAGGKKIYDQISSTTNFSFENLVPKNDFINTFTDFWHDYHWLSQIVMYKIYEKGGYLLLTLFFCLIAALTYKTILDIIYTLTGKDTHALLIAIIAIPVILLIDDVSSVRPQMIAILCLALSIKQLLNQPAKFEIAYLFLLTAILVNVHVYWVLIPFLFACYRCLPRLLGNKDISIAYAWGGLALLVLAGLISPYGILTEWGRQHILFNYALLWDYLHTSSYLKNVISEFRAPLAHPGKTSVIILTFITIFVKKINLKLISQKPGIVITSLVSLYLFLNAVKFASIFALFSLPLLVYLTKDFLVKYTERLNKINYSNELATYLIFFLLTFFILNTKDNLQKVKQNIATYLPVKACNHIAGMNFNKKDLRIATHFNYGGWCRWIIYEKRPDLNIQVTTDGRTQGIKDKHFKDSFNLYDVKEGWDKTLNKWHPDLILADRSKALAHVLPFMQSKWRNIYIDTDFAVYEATSDL